MRARSQETATVWRQRYEQYRKGGLSRKEFCRLGYQTAVLDYKKADYPAAVASLKAILDNGGAAPAMYLFLADIYQDNLNDAPSAISSLESYLALRADPDAETRLAKLKAARTQPGS